MVTLSISQFSEMCQLSAQTLRFYHAEGLLVPVEVDARTGYRSYGFDQVERAMLVAILRRAGLGVQQVRAALDDPDALPALLVEHRAELRRRRQEEDEALDDAEVFASAWPRVSRQHRPGTVVVRTVVPGCADLEAGAEGVRAAAAELVRTAEAGGAAVTGVAWKTPALDTVEQKRKVMTPDGPDWWLLVPVAADERVAPALPDGVDLAEFPARDELSIVLPGRETLPKFAAAVHRLVAHGVDEACAVDLGQPRHVLHPGGVEIAVAVWGAEDAPPPETVAWP